MANTRVFHNKIYLPHRDDHLTSPHVWDGNQDLQVVVLSCDAAFNASLGQSAFDFAMFYRGYLLLVGAAKGP